MSLFGPPPVLIRATNPYGYRYGHTHPWGFVHGVALVNGRPCYVVWFPHEVERDYWPVYDESDPYEFRDATTYNYLQDEEVAS